MGYLESPDLVDLIGEVTTNKHGASPPPMVATKWHAPLSPRSRLGLPRRFACQVTWLGDKLVWGRDRMISSTPPPTHHPEVVSELN